MPGKDQVTFAEYIGISVATLRKIEQNGGNVTMASVMKILDYCSLEVFVKVNRIKKT